MAEIIQIKVLILKENIMLKEYILNPQVNLNMISGCDNAYYSKDLIKDDNLPWLTKKTKGERLYSKC